MIFKRREKSKQRKKKKKEEEKRRKKKKQDGHRTSSSRNSLCSRPPFSPHVTISLHLFHHLAGSQAAAGAEDVAGVRGEQLARQSDPAAGAVADPPERSGIGPGQAGFGVDVLFGAGGGVGAAVGLGGLFLEELVDGFHLESEDLARG